MSIASLTIEQFRNLSSVDFECSSQINLFTGANAAGKTSLLEAIYVLGRARSFRSRNLKNLIQREKDYFQLLAKLGSAGERKIPVGMRQSEHALVARIDARPVGKLSDLALLFPIQWMGGELHRLVEEGPAYRRQYLDWGLFHVKPTYLQTWRRFQKLLKQRNAALRAAAPDREIRVWDTELATVGESLTRYRTDYVSRLQEVLRDILPDLLGGEGTVELRYRKGWLAELPLQQALEQGLARDREQGFTRAGPNRAEVLFLYQGDAVGERLSRGQQKLFIIALQVAQARLLRQLVDRTSLFLLDDLGSELDSHNQNRVMHLLHAIQAQAFVTAISEPAGLADWPTGELRRFHVKHGGIAEVV